MQRLPAKIALITGDTQSIGGAIAELFETQGAEVIVTGRRSLEEGQAIASQFGRRIRYIKLDVSREEDWLAAMAQIGKLDILVNNAGIEYPVQSTAPQNPEYCSLADWQAVHHTNLDGIFLGCKYAIRAMKSNPDSAIVNIGSRSGLVGVPSSAA